MDPLNRCKLCKGQITSTDLIGPKKYRCSYCNEEQHEFELTTFDPNTFGLQRVRNMINARMKRIEKDAEELTVLREREKDILDHKGRTKAIEWDFDQVKSMIDAGVSRQQMAKLLKVKYNTLNYYIFRMREEGKDI